MDGDTLLVGSIPLTTPAEALEVFGGPLGPHLASLPDGEVGFRQFWITRVHFQVLAIHPDLEVIQRPRRDDGIERIYAHDASDNWNFRVREGVEKVVFGHPGWRLGFYQEALNSYHVFKMLKQQGKLPAHLRFQVSIPAAVSALPPRVFPAPGDLAKVRPGYIDAVRAEVQAILEHIPPSELAIQWDCSSELQDAYGQVAGLPPEGMIERNLPQIHALSHDLPEEGCWAFTCALAPWAAGRASSRTAPTGPWSSPTPSSRAQGGGWTGCISPSSTARTTPITPRWRVCGPIRPGSSWA